MCYYNSVVKITTLLYITQKVRNEKFDDVKIKALYMYDTQTVVLFKKNNPLSDCSPLFKKYLDENNYKIKDIKIL